MDHEPWATDGGFHLTADTPAPSHLIESVVHHPGTGTEWAWVLTQRGLDALLRRWEDD